MNHEVVSPLLQLIGTLFTVLGGVTVAFIARGANKKEQPFDTTKLASHDDMRDLVMAINGLRISLHDQWQWQRDNLKKENHNEEE